jgi:glyoxylase-like metal-dependent hydrolase (beta-lactamase superfamily II)
MRNRLFIAAFFFHSTFSRFMSRSLNCFGVILLTLVLAIFSVHNLPARPHSLLRACYKKQSLPMESKVLRLSYHSSQNALYHDLEPWKVTHIATFGRVESGPFSFYQFDSSRTRRGKIISSRTQIESGRMYQQDDGETAIDPVTEAMYNEQWISIGRYSPQMLIYFTLNNAKNLVEVAGKRSVTYRFMLGKTKIELSVRRADTLLESITILSPHDLYGDVTTKFTYNNFATLSGIAVPRMIEASSINGKLIDTTTIESVIIINKPAPLFTIAPGYAFVPAQPKIPEIAIDNKDSHLHIIELKHTDDKVLAVEFKDFILLAEAPLNSANGDLIIRETRKLALMKPIKYFVFGHHHPHYLGGVRALVHDGATVLTTAPDADYVKYLIDAPHTLEPDSLQLDPKPLHLEVFADSTTVTDGEFVMKIYHIGEKSHHTKDYLVYYFPSEKILFEDDLVWIKTNAPITKAGELMRGLYGAIKDLRLDVTTIIQSWPVGTKYGVKTEIPFSDLEKSAEMK